MEFRGKLPRIPGDGSANAFGFSQPSTPLFRYGLTPGTRFGRWYPPVSPLRRLSVPRLTVKYGPDLTFRIGENCQLLAKIRSILFENAGTCPTAERLNT